MIATEFATTFALSFLRKRENGKSMMSNACFILVMFFRVHENVQEPWNSLVLSF